MNQARQLQAQSQTRKNERKYIPFCMYNFKEIFAQHGLVPLMNIYSLFYHTTCKCLMYVDNSILR